MHNYESVQVQSLTEGDSFWYRERMTERSENEDPGTGETE